jgi:hypothetical protein
MSSTRNAVVAKKLKIIPGTCPEENPKGHEYSEAKMPDLQTEIRDEKLQDIKQECYSLRYDIWSGVISGFLGGANEICVLLGV